MRRIPSLVLVAAAVVVASIFAAPLLRAAGATELADALVAWFGHACHQSPERSFHLFGHSLAVCARCTGVYVGVLVALAFALTRGAAGRWMPIAALAFAPLAIGADVGLAALGLHEPTLASRVLSGLALGAGIAVVLAQARFVRAPAALGFQISALVLLAVPLVACKKAPKQKPAPPAQVAPRPAPPPVVTAGCARDTDCKGNRVCVNGECVDREVPIIVEVPTGCTRDVDCKGTRVCVDGECREPSGPTTKVVEVVRSTRCDDCPGKCLAVKQKCNEGSVKDCFLAGACMCECKLAAGGCDSTPAELRSCISTNRAKARE